MSTWDIHCRVIDHHGDLGVCWRLSRSLAARGETVRMYVDDANALRWMAPDLVSGVTLHAWDAAGITAPGEVVISAFGCALPAAALERMADATTAPVWINLEYLSAESYVERSHGLASPQAWPATERNDKGRDGGRRTGRTLVQWFYYPGFTNRTGGLLRVEEGAMHHPGVRRGHERLVGVFGYAHADYEGLLRSLADVPTLIQAAQGPSLQSLVAHFVDGRSRLHPAVRLQAMPWMAQTTFDAWLHTCDLNVVRGEDSLVAAIHAGKPFIWNVYRQDDGAHVAKMEAMLTTMLAHAHHDVATRIRRCWHRMNRVTVAGDETPVVIDEALLRAWSQALAPWHMQLALQADLTTQLQRFVSLRVAGSPALDPSAPG